VRIRLPASGISIAKWFTSAFSLGHANTVHGARARVSQWASIAATFAG
jgi:hypothetical protein